MFSTECETCGREIELEESERRKCKKTILCYICQEVIRRERRVRRENEWEKYIEDMGE